MAEHHHETMSKYPERYSPELRAMLEYGASLSASKLDAFRVRVRDFATAVHGLMQPLCAMALPTTPRQAFDFDGSTPTDLADLTVVATAAGLPAVSTPLPTGEDLPVGMQILTAQGEDLLACEIATLFERAT
jgi:Asp-tRNA(Asn)/Glu-tRNA(Gln) amidotransferase A subunit family amidase